MRITVLVENTSTSEHLSCEHGLSLYIETGDKKILFDTGASDLFALNAAKLGIDLSQVDFAILSHSHRDHTGGLGRFLEVNKTAPVYANPHIFGPYYNGDGECIAPDPALESNPRLVFVNTEMQIASNLILHPGFTPRFPVETWGLSRLENGQYIPDDFRHEQYLLIQEGDKRICISGCSHKGILNIMDWYHPDILVGGFHFMKLDPDSPALTAAGEALAQYPTTYYTGHCTGAAQYTRLKAILGDRLQPISTGITIPI